MEINRTRGKTVKIALFNGLGIGKSHEETKAYGEIELNNDVKLIIIKSKVGHEKLDKDVLRYTLTCPETGWAIKKWEINGKTQKELLSKLDKYPDLAEKIIEGRNRINNLTKNNND